MEIVKNTVIHWYIRYYGKRLSMHNIFQRPLWHHFNLFAQLPVIISFVVIILSYSARQVQWHGTPARQVLEAVALDRSAGEAWCRYFLEQFVTSYHGNAFYNVTFPSVQSGTNCLWDAGQQVVVLIRYWRYSLVLCDIPTQEYLLAALR